VYDLTGKEIRTLLNGFRNAGSYEVSFDASDLTSGIYFYKLVSEKLSVSKKMILIR